MVVTSCIIFGIVSRHFLLAVFLGATVAEICEETNSASGVMFRKGWKDRRLVSSLLDTVSTLSVVECSLLCLRETGCQSFNYRKELNAMTEHDCELNSETASVDPDHITRNDSFIYYEIISTGKTCTKAPLGSRKEVPGKNCKDIKQSTNTSNSKEYWIQPEPDKPPFLVYCEMSLFGGGWTLVFRYTFTDYTNFYSSKNAVTPRPNWRASEANVEVSTTPPLNDEFGAIAYKLWRLMGNTSNNVLIRSNINDWYICEQGEGSLLLEMNGSISCKHVQEVAGNCSSAMTPTYISWENSGPLLRGSSVSIYRFDGSTIYGYPTHNSCSRSTRNEKKNVANPCGQILIR